VSFSGQQAYNDWFLSLYNVVFFNSLPVIALGVFDQDVSAPFCLKICLMFQCIFFCLTCDAWWLKSREFGYGVLSDWNLTVYGFREGGEVVIGLEILGTTLYTCIVLVVNCQMALSINYFTSIQHLFIWGGIVFWFIFLMVYGAILDPYLSTTAYKVFIEAPVHQPRLTGSSHCLCCYLSSLLPYFTYLTIQMRFFPFYHQMIPWRAYGGPWLL
jgi:hypothetical protein